MTTFRRFVAIGDSSTEGLEDPDGEGGYRGWADRLAVIAANAQAERLDYANLGVRGLRLNEVRLTQFDSALRMRPDLMSIFAGANDLLSVDCDFVLIGADLAAMFGEARACGCTVVTFTMPDPSAVNPFGRRFRGRMLRFNDIVRAEAERYGVLVMDFQHYPIIEDPRLFSEDRLHGNELGHERVAAAMAWRLGIDGSDESWAEPFSEAPPLLRTREQLVGDIQWARRYFAPWLGRGIRGARSRRKCAAKRPKLMPVPKEGRDPARPCQPVASQRYFAMAAGFQRSTAWFASAQVGCRGRNRRYRHTHSLGE